MISRSRKRTTDQFFLNHKLYMRIIKILTLQINSASKHFCGNVKRKPRWRHCPNNKAVVEVLDAITLQTWDFASYACPATVLGPHGYATPDCLTLGQFWLKPTHNQQWRLQQWHGFFFSHESSELVASPWWYVHVSTCSTSLHGLLKPKPKQSCIVREVGGIYGRCISSIPNSEIFVNWKHHWYESRAGSQTAIQRLIFMWQRCKTCVRPIHMQLTFKFYPMWQSFTVKLSYIYK